MSSNKKDTTERIKAVVEFTSTAELPFLSHSIPDILAKFPETNVYLFFPTSEYHSMLQQPALQELAAIDRVHVRSAVFYMSNMHMPIGNESLESMLTACNLIAAELSLSDDDLILRIPCYSLIANNFYFSSAASNGCDLFFSGGTRTPFIHSAYMLSVGVLSYISRIISLSYSNMCENGSCDVFLQSMAFAIANEKKMLYLSRNTETGASYAYTYDYDNKPEALKNAFVAGVVHFFRPGIALRNMTREARILLHFLNKPAE